MDIAQAKRRENIAEYILYLWQLEDLLRALHFYERMGMRKLREGDFPIGDGYYMNDYIMGLDIK